MTHFEDMFDGEKVLQGLEALKKECEQYGVYDDTKTIYQLQEAVVIARLKAEIDKLDYLTMARLLRFSKPGGVTFFGHEETWAHFKNRFQAFGGWTSEISKEIGWE